VNRLVLSALVLLALPAAAADVDATLDSAIRAALPVCDDGKVVYSDLTLALPAGFKGTVVKVESASGHCATQLAGVLSPAGEYFLGSPWPIAKEPGETIEEKLKSFTWRNMRQNMDPVVDRSKKTASGLYTATLTQTTEAGRMPLVGEVDAAGTMFFFGRFRPASGDVRTSRSKVFEPYVASSPARGANDAKITIIEFSDFQCPSCKRASGWVEPILEKHSGKVRYVRFDLPLTGHAWAFPAALAGRAIYRQKPEAFWDYKKQVYENQDTMNAFTFWDWARGFAADHDLDLARYDADLASAELKAEILTGAGTAFTNDIRATPSYLVNGAIVEVHDGAALAAYVDTLLAK
jgi:protein-disulfide isomerase